MSAVMSADPIAPARDAVSLLTADHDKAKAMFAEYQRIKDTGTAAEKFEIAKQVCGDLLIHLAIEEALFYPPVRKSIKQKDLVKQGEGEHEEAKELIRQLGDMDPASPEFDEKMQKLYEGINHHVEEEENEMFPEVRKSRHGLEDIGKQMQEAKNDMRVRLGLPPEE
jgi:hemerythrin-like domain-containing protein